MGQHSDTALAIMKHHPELGRWVGEDKDRAVDWIIQLGDNLRGERRGQDLRNLQRHALGIPVKEIPQDVSTSMTSPIRAVGRGGAVGGARPHPLVGPGTEMKELLRQLGIESDGCGGCTRTLEYMNQLGPAGVREKIQEIEAQINQNRKTASVSWLDKAKAAANGLLRGYTSLRSLILEAARRAEAKAALPAATTQRSLVWAVGVTTCHARLHTYLPRTLTSLGLAGLGHNQVAEFRLSIDGLPDETARQDWLEMARRRNLRPGSLSFREGTPTRTYGNWVLTAWEILIRCPIADRYCLFQDDLVLYRQVRQYLEQIPYPEAGYLNLFAELDNEYHVEQLANGKPGFYEGSIQKGTTPEQGWHNQAPQVGRGALSLVFSRDTLLALLGAQHFIGRVTCPQRGWRNVDGGIVQAMNQLGYREQVHWPSLVEHTGQESTIGLTDHQREGYPPSRSFRGEEFNAMDLLPSNAP